METNMDLIKIVGLVGAIVMPLWNIPLIMRIVQRQSSDDISILWAIGVWVCIVLMVPEGTRSPSLVLKAFDVMNLIMFSGVVFTVVKYHKKIRGMRGNK